MSNSPTDITLGGFDSFERKLGDELRGERATMGKSLLDVQRELRVKAAYISAIENCDVSVFPNASFVAGYVRSYARYLELDPEVAFQRFCVEARFQSASAELGDTAKKPRNIDVRPITDPQSWTPNMPGKGGDFRSTGAAGATLAAAGPALVLAAVVGMLGYGAWFVIKDIQRVEFAPVEDNPMVAFEPDNLGASSLSGSDGFLASGIEIAADPSILYSRRELEIPVVEPRDGPIFAINPDADIQKPLVEAEAAPGTEVATVVEGSPRVSETPYVPSVSIVAQQEAWVRVYQENGTIIFEKTLAAGEQYSLPDDTPTAYLRAGNATYVYVMIDDEAYGPLSNNANVVRDIPLLPTAVATNMAGVDSPSVALQVAAEAWRNLNTARLDQ